MRDHARCAEKPVHFMLALVHAQALQSKIMSLDVTSVGAKVIPFARSFFNDDANEQVIRKGPGYRPLLPNHGSRQLR